MNKNWLARSACVGTALFAIAGHAYAADGWKLRFPLSGTLGGEIVSNKLNPGLFGNVVVTQVEVDKMSGNDGDSLRLTQAGSFSTSPNLVAGQVRTASYSGSAAVAVKQSQTNTNLLLGYLTEEEYYGGRLVFSVNIPHASLSRTFTVTGTTPTLSSLAPAVVPLQAAAQAQAAVQQGFGTNYQATLASNSAKGTGSASAVGDIEVTGAWVQVKDNVKVVLGTTLAMPTGQYDKDSALNVGFGNYYTLRSGAAVSFKTNENLTLGARASLGFNSPNTDNGVRTGNFWGLDLAAAYLTPIGVFGPHLLQVTQYEDDQGGNFGGNRFSATGAGVFYTTLIRPINAGLNFSYMQMLDSRNALSGSFVQIRLTKAF